MTQVEGLVPAVCEITDSPVCVQEEFGRTPECGVGSVACALAAANDESPASAIDLRSLEFSFPESSEEL